MNELKRPVSTTNHAVMIQKCVKLTQNEEKLSHNKEKLSLNEGKLTNKWLDSIPNHGPYQPWVVIQKCLKLTQNEEKLSQNEDNLIHREEKLSPNGTVKLYRRKVDS